MQSTRNLMASFTAPTERAARSIPYLILLRGGFALRAAFQPRRWSLTPPFHHCGARLVVRSVRACALTHSLPRSESLPRFANPSPSILCGTFRRARLPCALRPSRADPLPCGVRTFLCLAAATGRSRAASGEIVKYRDTGCGRTSCRQQGPHCGRRAATRSAAGRDGNHRIRRRV